MISYVSTRGGVLPQPFDKAVLQGFAEDGGLFVPETVPKLSMDRLTDLSGMDYPDLAAAILSLFIDPSVIPEPDLARLVRDSFSPFERGRVVNLIPLNGDPSLMIMELFHGPTLSFKDIAMGFLIRTMDYLLQKKGPGFHRPGHHRGHRAGCCPCRRRPARHRLLAPVSERHDHPGTGIANDNACSR